VVLAKSDAKLSFLANKMKEYRHSSENSAGIFLTNKTGFQFTYFKKTAFI